MAALVAAPTAVSAVPVIILQFSGTFDGASGRASALNGTDYSAAFVLGTTSNSVARYAVDPFEQRATFDYKYPYRSAFQTVGGSLTYNETDGNTVDFQDNFIYDGSLGLVSAGTYDVVNITGHLFTTTPMVNAAACSPNPFEDDPNCAPQGVSIHHDLTLIGSSDMFSGLNGPLFDRIDFSKVKYGLYSITAFDDGVQVGQAIQDPPLTFDNGLFLGDGMRGTLTVTDVPEPASWVMMIGGFLVVGCAARRSQALQQAAA